jgi:hypothetical protein
VNQNLPPPSAAMFSSASMAASSAPSAAGSSAPLAAASSAPLAAASAPMEATSTAQLRSRVKSVRVTGRIVDGDVEERLKDKMLMEIHPKFGVTTDGALMSQALEIMMHKKYANQTPSFYKKKLEAEKKKFNKIFEKMKDDAMKARLLTATMIALHDLIKTAQEETKKNRKRHASAVRTIAEDYKKRSVKKKQEESKYDDAEGSISISDDDDCSRDDDRDGEDGNDSEDSDADGDDDSDGDYRERTSVVITNSVDRNLARRFDML